VDERNLIDVVLIHETAHYVTPGSCTASILPSTGRDSETRENVMRSKTFRNRQHTFTYRQIPTRRDFIPSKFFRFINQSGTRNGIDGKDNGRRATPSGSV
jgi:hypothetical protein